MSVNTVMALTFLPGMRNWNTGVSRRDIEVIDPQAGHLSGIGYIGMYHRIGYGFLSSRSLNEALPWGVGGGGGPRSLVGIVKCLVSAFCQEFTSLSEIERHTFVPVRRLSLFHLGAVATFWPMSLVGIYSGRAS